MERGAQITVYVDYQNRRMRIGAERRFKSEFCNLNIFLDEIETSFVGIIPCSYILQLWHRQNDFPIVGISSDEDLKNAIERCRSKKIVIFAEKAREEVDVSVRHLKRRVEALEGEIVTLKEENKGLRELVDDLERRLGVCEYIEIHDAQQGAVQGVPQPAGGPSSSVNLGRDIKIKKESEELVD